MKRATKGSITIDFTFALALVAVVSAVLLSMCLTLAITEVAQYAAFSTSRVYFGGHFREDWQKDLAQKKFDELMKKPGFKIFTRTTWFELKYSGNGLGAGDHRDLFPGNTPEDNDTFWGVILEFNSKVLNVNFPLFGGADNDNGFKVKINSFLGREPTFDECDQFTRQRWSNIKYLMQVQIPSGQDDYVPLEDNGC